MSLAEEQTQLAIWSISAAPLIMGNDLRNVSAASRAVLLNPHAIAINQDGLGQVTQAPSCALTTAPRCMTHTGCSDERWSDGSQADRFFRRNHAAVGSELGERRHRSGSLQQGEWLLSHPSCCCSHPSCCCHFHFFVSEKGDLIDCSLRIIVNCVAESC